MDPFMMPGIPGVGQGLQDPGIVYQQMFWNALSQDAYKKGFNQGILDRSLKGGETFGFSQPNMQAFSAFPSTPMMPAAYQQAPAYQAPPFGMQQGFVPGFGGYYPGVPPCHQNQMPPQTAQITQLLQMLIGLLSQMLGQGSPFGPLGAQGSPFAPGGAPFGAPGAAPFGGAPGLQGNPNDPNFVSPALQEARKAGPGKELDVLGHNSYDKLKGGKLPAGAPPPEVLKKLYVEGDKINGDQLTKAYNFDMQDGVLDGKNNGKLIGHRQAKLDTTKLLNSTGGASAASSAAAASNVQFVQNPDGSVSIIINNSASAAAAASAGDGKGTNKAIEDSMKDIKDPLVLDLNGDGKLSVDPNKEVQFDLDGDGKKDTVHGWTGEDGFLVHDYNGGEITGKNLFGPEAKNGFEEMKKRDANKDGRLSGEELQSLKVWKDGNADGKVDEGEMKSLQELGITEINVNEEAKDRGSYLQNGQRTNMFQWWPELN
ncbi:MAG: hypothetical protein HYU64_00595 [Armatimonadetes bacterium]|nr:hypothetical protein [Armatimonadota bacterium]